MMLSIPTSHSLKAREIKREADMLAIVGQYTRLRRSGRQYVCLCPFHSERHPSCYVDPERKIFHCFGCGAGGDLFVFLMLAEACDFFRALGIAAGFSGGRPRERAPKGRAVSSGRRGLPPGLAKPGSPNSQSQSRYVKPEPKPCAVGELPPLVVDCAAERAALADIYTSTNNFRERGRVAGNAPRERLRGRR